MIKKFSLILAGLVLVFTSCKQERMLFYPDKLPADHKFTFERNFEECFFQVDSKTTINGLLFHADSSKGLIFYLHGNAGSLESWGQIAPVYLNNGYDFFILDYRGYGKSEGTISGEKQLYQDIQSVYDTLTARYNENTIIIIGYSIGTGLAAHLASENEPKMVILKAPYYNLPDLVHQYYSFIPNFLIRYRLKTNEYLSKINCPVIIFHGDQDEVIYVGSSYKLKELFKSDDQLFILHGQGHNGINDNPEYREKLKELLK